MPYICTDQNRYLGEHDCGLHHYGNAAMLRPCCIADAAAHKTNALRVAMTASHPGHQLFRSAFRALTDAERAQVGDLCAVYDHGPAGFAEIPWPPMVWHCRF